MKRLRSWVSGAAIGMPGAQATLTSRRWHARILTLTGPCQLRSTSADALSEGLNQSALEGLHAS